ncbi:alpha/beta hydrolase [Candidatus Saccharibacteria bacterium]|nr:alpha/beta hydrolase [Candidatus Saccharibacteria bacterium]
MKSTSLHWRPSKNGVTVDASLDVVVHPGKTNEVVLIVPGVDGSVDGYEDKYIKMANLITDHYGSAVVRISNPFISSFHWEDNIRKALEFIEAGQSDYFDVKPASIRIIGHSAGASVAAWLAHEYPKVRQLTLINMAEKLEADRIEEGLKSFDGSVELVYGSEDPSIEFGRKLGDKYKLTVVEGADHNFSGDHTERFIKIPIEVTL